MCQLSWRMPLLYRQFFDARLPHRRAIDRHTVLPLEALVVASACREMDDAFSDAFPCIHYLVVRAANCRKLSCIGMPPSALSSSSSFW